MVKLQQTSTVTPEHKLLIEVPAEVTPGEHQVTVLIDTQPVSQKRTLNLIPLYLNNPSDFTYRRTCDCETQISR